MTSPLLALFTRSLREDTRSKSTYWARGGLATFILLLGAVLAFVQSQRAATGGAPGLFFFSIIIWLQIVSVTLVGLSWFASAITEEKEEETLGLLRMTNLNPLSILLGKSTSRLCGAQLLLAAQLPFTLLAITLGGVSLAQILASYCTLGAYTFFLCNLALLWSVLTPNTARAAVGTIVALAAYFSAGPLLGSLHAALLKHDLLGTSSWSAVEGKLGGMAAAVTAITPTAQLTAILRTGFSAGPVGWPVWINVLLGLVCFFTAWAAFTRFADRALEGVSASSARRRVLGFRLRRPPRPWKNALAWKDFHFLCGGTPAFIARLIFYGALTAWMTFPDPDSSPIFQSIFSTIASMAFLIELAVIASRIFRAELRDETWSSLALLPLTIRQVAYRKLLGGLLALVPAGVTVVLATGLFMVNSVQNNAGSWDAGWPPATIFISTLSSAITALFIAHLIAWLSLLLKRGALALGFVIAYAVTIVVQILSMMLSFASAFRTPSSMSIRMMIVPLVTASIYLVATLLLHRAILRRAEALAAES